MFKLRASLIATILGTVLVTGCITVKRPLWTTAVNYNRSIERSENKLLLLNIVRSSKRLPRYYSAVTGVTSTVNVGLTPSLSFTDSSGDSLSSVDGSAAGVAANGIVNAVTEGVTDTLTSAIGLPQASTTGVQFAIQRVHCWNQPTCRPRSVRTFLASGLEPWNASASSR